MSLETFKCAILERFILLVQQVSTVIALLKILFESDVTMKDSLILVILLMQLIHSPLLSCNKHFKSCCVVYFECPSLRIQNLQQILISD